MKENDKAAESQKPEEKPVEKEAAAKKEEKAAEKKDEKAAEIAALEQKVAELEKKSGELAKDNADLKDQLLRRAADFDNYRKRTLREKQETFDFANENLLKDLLDCIDDFDRTVDAAATAKDPKTIADGIKMINKKLVSLLETKYNLSGYGAAGDVFNPDEHEAIGSQPGPVAEQTLAQVYLKGYKLKGKVIRHAKVMVTTPDGTVKADTKKAEQKPEDGKADAAAK